MLKKKTSYICAFLDGSEMPVPDFVVTLYEAHSGIGGGRLNAIPMIKWLRANLGISLLEAKILHESLCNHIKPNS